MPSLPDSDSGPAGGRRLLIAAGTARYRRLDEKAQLPGVVDEVDRVVDVFVRRLGYRRELEDIGRDPTSVDLRSTLSAWFSDRERDASDTIVLYYSGHGWVTDRRRFVLATSDSDKSNVAGTTLTPIEIAWMLDGSCAERVMVILDTCFAGHGAPDFTKSALTAARSVRTEEAGGLYCLAVAGPVQKARPGAFAAALGAAIANRAHGGAVQPFLGLEDLLEDINEHFRAEGRSQRAELHVARMSGRARFFPNPRRETGAMPGQDLEVQRLTASAAISESEAARFELAGEAALHFTGREGALRMLVEWLGDRDLPPVMFVTGAAGSGKSALLSRLTVLADPELTAVLAQDDVGSDVRPAAGSIDCAIRATARSASDLVERVAVALRLGAGAPIGELAALAGARTIVLDALDEAIEPAEVAYGFVRPLVAAGWRLIVSARDPRLRRLCGETALLDLSEHRDDEDVLRYAHRLLAEGGGPHDDMAGALADLAVAVAGAATGNFLIAGVLARALRAAPKILPAGASGLPARSTVAGALDALLAQFGSDERRVRDLLRPLAYARGAGMPWEDVWPEVASALSGHRYTDADIEWLLANAAPLIREDLEDDGSVYRLFHERLASHLSEHARTAHHVIVDALLELVPVVPGSTRRDWPRAHPYIRRHLSTHAALAGRVDELVVDPGYLLAAEPTRLLRAAVETSEPAGRAAGNVYRRAAHALASSPPEEHGAYLAFAAHKSGHRELAAAIAALDRATWWWPEWARWRPSPPHQVLYRHTGPAPRVAAAELAGKPVVASASSGEARTWDLEAGAAPGPSIPLGDEPTGLALACVDGRPVVVVGCDGGDVRAFEVGSGKLMGALPSHGEAAVVAVADVDGQPTAVSGGADGVVRFSRLADGVQVREPIVVGRPVVDVAAAECEGRRVVVTVDKREAGPRLCVWDGTDASLLGETLVAGCVATAVAGSCVLTALARGAVAVHRLPDAGHLHDVEVPPGYMPVGAVATAEVGEERLLFSAVWNQIAVQRVDDARAVESVWRGHDASILALAATRTRGRATLISAAADCTVRSWDVRVASDKPHSAEIGDEAVGAIELVDVRGDSSLVGIGGGGALVEWSPATGEPAGRSGGTGQGSWYASIRTCERAGRPVAVVGRSDGSLFALDLLDRAPVWERSGAHRLIPWGIVVSGGIVVSAGEGMLRSRLEDGAPVGSAFGEAFVGPTAGGIATFETDHQRLVAAGSDGAVGIWDLDSEAPIAVVETGGSVVRALAVVEGDLPRLLIGTDRGVLARGLDGAEVPSPALGAGWVSALAIGRLQDRACVIAGVDRTLRIGALDGGAVRTIDLESQINAIAVDSPSHLLVGTNGGLVRLRVSP